MRKSEQHARTPQSYGKTRMSLWRFLFIVDLFPDVGNVRDAAVLAVEHAVKLAGIEKFAPEELRFEPVVVIA